MFNWNDRATKPRLVYTHEDGTATYEIGRYHVKCKIDEDITYHTPRHGSTDPRSTLPNMEVVDGQIKLDLADLIDIILSRVEPIEIAEALWQNEEVRDAFIYKMTERYSSDYFTDADRRKFLTAVKEQVHDNSANKLHNKLSSIEYNLTRLCGFYQEIGAINRLLRDLNVMVKRPRHIDGQWVDEEVLLQFNDLEKPIKDDNGVFQKGELELFGKTYQEAQAFWRDYIAKHYPGPVESKVMVPINPEKVAWTEDLYKVYEHFGTRINQFNTMADLEVMWKGILSGVLAGQEDDDEVKS